MTIEDFIELPASEAGGLYRRHRDAGDAGEASRLHQAYYEAHRVRLSDDQQVEEAQPPPPAAATATQAGVARGNERSRVRRIGILLSCLGLAISTFALAAGIGAGGLIVGGGLTSFGFALWLVGILEDQLIAIRHAIEVR